MLLRVVTRSLANARGIERDAIELLVDLPERGRRIGAEDVAGAEYQSGICCFSGSTSM